MLTGILKKKLNYTLETIPEMGDVVYLKSTANLSTGGTVDDMLHPENIFLAERISRVIGLDVWCGYYGRELTQPLKRMAVLFLK
jgi:cyanophycin synthetase